MAGPGGLSKRGMRTGLDFSAGTSAARPAALDAPLLDAPEAFGAEDFVESVVGTALSVELVIGVLGLGAALASALGAGGCDDPEGSTVGEGFGSAVFAGSDFVTPEVCARACESESASTAQISRVRFIRDLTFRPGVHARGACR